MKGGPAVIRRASEVDAAALSSIHDEIQAIHAAALPEWFKPPGPPQITPQMIAAASAEPATYMLVADIDGIPVGYAYAKVLDRPETQLSPSYRMLFITEIGVRATHRRRGVGRALIEAVRSAATDSGIEFVALDVWAFNSAAHAFFRHCGFDPYRHYLKVAASHDP